jgi:hypothetical protein
MLLPALNSYFCREDPMSRNPKQTSTGISLLTLAFGFSLLGILSFLNRLQGELGFASAVENNFYVAGSAVSVLAGMIFLAAACIYWRQ